MHHSVAKDKVNEEERRKCRVLLHYYLITFIDYEESLHCCCICHYAALELQ